MSLRSRWIGKVVVLRDKRWSMPQRVRIVDVEPDPSGYARDDHDGTPITVWFWAVST